MIYLFENINNDASIIYDDTFLSIADKTRAVQVEELPYQEIPQGKYAVLKCKKTTNDVWWEYLDNPETELTQRIAAIEGAFLALLFPLTI